jgi:hypothetical protein
MKKGKSYLCPLCGRKKKPAPKTSRADVREGVSVLRAPRTAVADSVVAESSNDQTANDFAAVLLKDRKKRL